jgi:hypothetical protein
LYGPPADFSTAGEAKLFFSEAVMLMLGWSLIDNVGAALERRKMKISGF